MKKYLLFIFTIFMVSFSCMKDYSNPLLSNLEQMDSGTIHPIIQLEIQPNDLPEVKITIPAGSVPSAVDYSLSQLTRLELLPAGPATPIGPFVYFKIDTEVLLKPYTISIEIPTAAVADSFFIGCYHNNLWEILDTEFDAVTHRFSTRTTNDGYIGVFTGTPQNLLSLVCQPALLYYHEDAKTFYSPITAAAVGNVPETVHANISFLWHDKLSEFERIALIDIVDSQQPETYSLVSVNLVDSLLTNIVYQTYSADQHSDFYLKKAILNQIFQLKPFSQVTCQFSMALPNKILVTSLPIIIPVISSTAAVNATQVLIPEGPFFSGQDPTENRVVAAFYIDKFEVTTQQYATFLNNISLIESLSYFVDDKLVKNGGNTYITIQPALNGLQHTVSGYSVVDDFAQRPVTGVTWFGARAYAQYYSQRLPASLEWEKAARGMNGNLYPWGNDEPSFVRCNWHENDRATDVGTYRPQGDSPYGIADMAGNVIEWCGDTYTGADEKILHGG
ncbi:SUMF1/EgtB/PvdO family nonheme iron enzyme, partial [bacterium]|nr:SUMF1/EgtB/PvdO family nonheme iron enzyme [bacterium]